MQCQTKLQLAPFNGSYIDLDYASPYCIILTNMYNPVFFNSNPTENQANRTIRTLSIKYCIHPYQARFSKFILEKVRVCESSLFALQGSKCVT